MNKPVKVLLFYLSFIVLLTNCEDNLDYYERPESLAAPMYQQLDSMGNFTNFLALAEKAGYARTLKGSGYWTLFAPTDAAFEEWFQEKGISGISEVDEETARGIVTYALVYNAYTAERLSDYQDQAALGWVEDVAFKRKTAYYDGVFTARSVEINGEMVPEMQVIADNRHGGSAYVVRDNGHKYIPYFTQEYFDRHNLTAADYNYFYPKTEWVKFNVAGAKVEIANLFAENGYIHVVDKVIEPLPNVEQHLAKNEEYSNFRSILEKHLTSYDNTSEMSAELTNRYSIITGIPDRVAIKSYNRNLVFAPNGEEWEDSESGQWIPNETQAKGNTIFVPDNQSLDNYISSVLLEHYDKKDDISQLPSDIIADFISAHMWAKPVWPSKFAVSRNRFGDPANFDIEAEITEKEMLSNAMFYGTNKVVESNLFHSVYGRAYLDPDYTMMIRVLGPAAKSILTQEENFYTLFLVSNDALKEAGYVYNEEVPQWEYYPPGGGREITGSDAALRLQRVIDQHVALVKTKDALADLSGEGIVKTYSEEFIKFKDKQLYTAGNLDAGEVVNITEGPIYAENGVVYLLDKILQVSDLTIADHLEQNFGESYFWQYIKNSVVYVNQGIDGTTAGSPYTVLVPTDAAIEQAIRDEVLPGTVDAQGNVTPNFTAADPIAKAMVADFIKYHIVANSVLVDGAIGNDLADISYTTVYKNLEGETGLVRVSDGPNGEGPTTFQDVKGRSAEVIPGEKSNVLSNWAVIHQVDNYLNYGL